MAASNNDHSITCPSCGTQITLSRALRAGIEASMKAEFAARERALRDELNARQEEDVARAVKDAEKKAETRVGEELTELREQLKEQAARMADARRVELALRKRGRELEKQQADLEITLARTLDAERATLVAEAEGRFAEQHRLKDGEKDRQLADMRRQIENLKRKADQGSQQAQGEAGEDRLETLLREAFPQDELTGIAQGLRGADLHQIVVNGRGTRCGAILWECKNARSWSDAWIAKLKSDQRALHADLAVLVSATLPKGCATFALLPDGVIVTSFACAATLASVLRVQLQQIAQARQSAATKEEKLELLYRYLSGVEFRQRVEAVVDAFAKMRGELDQERRAAERQWARRAKQIEAVTFNVSGMYGDLQGLVPALPSLRLLELPADAA
jgi:hypothetical protein